MTLTNQNAPAVVQVMAPRRTASDEAADLHGLMQCVDLCWPQMPIKAGLVTGLDRVIVIGWAWTVLGHDLSVVVSQFRELVASVGKLQRLIGGTMARPEAHRFAVAVLDTYRLMGGCTHRMATAMLLRVAHHAPPRPPTMLELPAVTLVAEVLPDKRPLPQEVRIPRGPPLVLGPMQQVVSSFLALPRQAEGPTLAELTSGSRRKRVVKARHEAIWLVHQLTDKTLPETGAFFGGRDHTSVLHAVRKVTRLMAGNPDYAAAMHDVLATVAAELTVWATCRPVIDPHRSITRDVPLLTVDASSDAC